MSLKTKLEVISKKNEKNKEILDSKFYRSEWKSYGLPNPFDIVKEFIKKKGLKLYGGLALHKYLKKHNAGLYNSYEFPDFDVMSPDAWSHAKELADHLHKLGFMFVEARSSVLNDYHHYTFKVSVDMIYIIDITQAGCTPEQLKEKQCVTCGQTKNGRCMKLFDSLPAVDSTFSIKKPLKTYRKTYDYTKKESLYPNKLFVMHIEWLKGQLYKELSQPLGNPLRLPKLGTRLELIEKFYDYEQYKCSSKQYNQIVKEHMIPILKQISVFIKNKNLINYGATTYNFFVKTNKNIGSLNVSDYKVYAENPIYFVNMVIESLRKKFKNYTFGYLQKLKFWKGQEDKDYIVYVKHKDKVNNLITFTEIDKCIPYVQYNGIKYVTIDRLKYLYLRSMSIPKFVKNVEDDSINYRCLLSNIVQAEKKYKRSKKKTKFRRYVSKCHGSEVSKIMQTLSERWYDRKKQLKQTKFLRNKPKKGFITKIYNYEKEDKQLPYRPEEEELKKR